jgi:signal transduction histidine kinase
MTHGSAVPANLRNEETRVLAEEQGALRRVATLVARGIEQQELFTAVIEEVGRLFPIDLASLCRYESDGSLTFLASWGTAIEFFPAGSRRMLGGNNLGTIVFETGRSARIDNYSESSSGAIGVTAHAAGINSSLATPVMVEGRLWGVIAAGSMQNQPLQADTEARLANFTDLLATAIANAESRAGLARLAEEQAALRRVATLVARGATPEAVFEAVTAEIGSLLPVDSAGMARYESDGAVVFVASWGRAADIVPVGSRWRAEGKNIGAAVFEAGTSVRIDDYADASGRAGINAREHGIRSSVGTPIVVEDHVWGFLGAASSGREPLPVDTEARLASFTELVATAIASAEARADLAASRARIVAAADETRRRVERDLHDGAQQRLVSLGLELRAANAAVPPQLAELRRQLSHISEEVTSVFEELREISHGIHPANLSNRGLVPALKALSRRSLLPIEFDLHVEHRLPEPIEIAAYYVVSEALTNTAKHAHASIVHIGLHALDTTVRLAVHDDGIGGADRHGSGLLGLSDRIEVLGGTLQVISPVGEGTTLSIEIPLEGSAARP